MRPKYIKYPECDGLNYMLEGEEACPQCNPPVATSYQVRKRGGESLKYQSPKPRETSPSRLHTVTAARTPRSSEDSPGGLLSSKHKDQHGGQEPHMVPG